MLAFFADSDLEFRLTAERICATVPVFREDFYNPEGMILLTYFIATPPDRGWQRSEGLLLLHSFLSLDILVAFSILRFGTSAKSVS